MPIQWTLKKWLATERDIYRPSELQILLREKAGVKLSLQAVSALVNSTPKALRLRTMEALCDTLDCKLSDFCQVLPTEVERLQEYQPFAGAKAGEIEKDQDFTNK